MISPGKNRWYAIRTKYKCEKYVVNQLQKRGVEAYVPLLHKKVQYVRKTKDVAIPLMNCYAFVFISKEEYTSVLSSLYVVGFLKIANEITPIPCEEIEILKQVVGEKQLINCAPLSWEVGDEVEVVGGSLTGLKGKLVGQKKKKEFVVELTTIGFQIRMEIEDHYLRPLAKRAFA